MKDIHRILLVKLVKYFVVWGGVVKVSSLPFRL